MTDITTFIIDYLHGIFYVGATIYCLGATFVASFWEGLIPLLNSLVNLEVFGTPLQSISLYTNLCLRVSLVVLIVLAMTYSGLSGSDELSLTFVVVACLLPLAITISRFYLPFFL